MVAATVLTPPSPPPPPLAGHPRERVWQWWLAVAAEESGGRQIDHRCRLERGRFLSSSTPLCPTRSYLCRQCLRVVRHDSQVNAGLLSLVPDACRPYHHSAMCTTLHIYIYIYIYISIYIYKNGINILADVAGDSLGLLQLSTCRLPLRHQRLALRPVSRFPIRRLARLAAVEGAPALDAHVQRRAVLP